MKIRIQDQQGNVRMCDYITPEPEPNWRSMYEEEREAHKFTRELLQNYKQSLEYMQTCLDEAQGRLEG